MVWYLYTYSIVKYYTSMAIWARSIAAPGYFSEGLRTIVLPVNPPWSPLDPL
jgi:hypothetical protein